MRIVFMGSGEVACPALERLLASDRDQVVAVVTQPDRPQGRNLRVAACPAKVLAEAAGVPVLTPERIGAPEAVQEIQALAPDLFVVAAYGQYIPPRILAIPPLRAINIHPSLLPKYRGAAPIQSAIAAGDRETGVTILYVSQEMDAGDILLQRSFPIGENETAATLSPQLAQFGAELLMETIEALREGRAVAIPQDAAQATTVFKLSKEDGRIDWSLPAEMIRNRIRGYTPWPGCYTFVEGKRLKVLQAVITPDQSGLPGDVLRCEAEGPVVQTGQGGLLLIEVQPEGKKAMSGAAFLCGHQPKRLG